MNDKVEELEMKGIRYMILNTHAFSDLIIASEIEKFSASSNLVINYSVKQ